MGQSVGGAEKDAIREKPRALRGPGASLGRDKESSKGEPSKDSKDSPKDSKDSPKKSETKDVIFPRRSDRREPSEIIYHPSEIMYQQIIL